MKSSGRIIISHNRTIQQLVWSSQHHQGPSRVGYYIAMLSYDSWWVKKISQATYPSLSEALSLWGWALVGNGHLLPNEWYSPSTSPIVCPNFWRFFLFEIEVVSWLTRHEGWCVGVFRCTWMSLFYDFLDLLDLLTFLITPTMRLCTEVEGELLTKDLEHTWPSWGELYFQLK